MRTRLIPAVLFASLTATLAAAPATGQAPARPAAPAKAPKTITLTGCIVSDETAPGQYTFADAKDGTMYRLSGTDVNSYVGQRVQISGASDRKKLEIRGGLLPSPNVAGQMGAIDSTQSAMGGKPPIVAGTGSATLPEFRVRAVRPVKGTCPAVQK